jgi:uncharacterized protein
MYIFKCTWYDWDMVFVWDSSKSSSNHKKHGVTFSEAATVFSDEFARLIHDPDHSEDEDRFILLGMSSGVRFLIVVHVYKEDEEKIRIISARKANKNEQNRYKR